MRKITITPRQCKSLCMCVCACMHVCMSLNGVLDVLAGEIVHPSVCHHWVPGVNWESKCQLSMSSVISEVQVGLWVPTSFPIKSW